MDSTFELKDITPDTSNFDLEGSGHSYISALRELVDNAIDSGSEKVNMFFAKDTDGKEIFVITDFGSGFDVDNVEKMVTYNWSNKKDSHVNVNGNKYLGKYGGGLKKAVAKLTDSKHCTILTKTVDSNIGCIEYNQKNIQITGQYLVAVKSVKYSDDSIKYINYWRKYMEVNPNDLADNGTLLILRGLKPDCSYHFRTMIKNNKFPLNKSLAIILGETYHRFIEKGLEINIGLTQDTMYTIKPFDPVYGTQPAEVYDFTLMGLPVKISAHFIPQSYSRKFDCSRQINTENCGVYPYRGNRLHLDISNLPINPMLSQFAVEKYCHGCEIGQYTKNGRRQKRSPEKIDMKVFGVSHGRHNDIRFVLDFSPELDSYFNVNANKTEIDLLHTELTDAMIWMYCFTRNNDVYDTGRKKSRTKSNVKEEWRKLVRKHQSEVSLMRQSIVQSLREEQSIAETVITLFTEELGQSI